MASQDTANSLFSGESAAGSFDDALQTDSTPAISSVEETTSSAPEETQVVENVETQEQQQETTPAVEETQAPKQKGVEGFTAEQIEQISKMLSEKKVEPVQEQQLQTQQTPRQLTPEEQDKAFNKVKVDQALYSRIFDSESQEESMAALDEYGQAVARQALTMSYHLINDMRQQMMNQLTPYMRMADNMQDQQLSQAFATAHPDLKDMGPIVDQVKKELVAEAKGKQIYKSQEELFSAIADRTKKKIEQLKGLGLGQQQPTQQSNGTQPQRKPQMSTLNGAGQSGAGDAGSVGGGNQNTAQRLFG